MHCPQCQTRVSIRNKFCGQCAAALPTNELSGPADEAREYARDVFAEGKVVAKEAAAATKAGMKTDVGKSVAACAAIGAVVAVPIPFVGPLLGAAVGAGIGFIRKKL